MKVKGEQYKDYIFFGVTLIMNNEMKHENNCFKILATHFVPP